jgi:iron complex outermembrane receptor protein
VSKSILLAASALALVLPCAAYAQSAEHDHAHHAAAQAADAGELLSPLTVTAQGGSLTQPNLQQQRAEVFSTAGSVGFIDAETLQGRYANTMRDMLKDAPGVFAQARYGQEVRLSIRGSGMGRGYHLRGLDILQDGVPWNMADGSGDFYEIDPLSLRSIEVYKGGNGLQYGASSLGGAVNFVTPTALTAVAPTILRVEGGSFSTFRASATHSAIMGNFDALVTVTGNTSAGARQHSRSNYFYLNGNLGWRINDRVENRTYISIDDTRQELPGSLTLQQALTQPQMAAPASANRVAGGHQQRNDAVQRVANRTSVRLANGQVDVDLFAYHKHLYHPIFQVILQDGWTWGGDVRYRGSYTLGGHRDELLAGALVSAGRNNAEQYLNFAGHRLNNVRTGDAVQKAMNFNAWIENRFYVTPEVALTTGVKYLSEQRELDNRLAPTKSGDKTFSGLSPKVGVLWQATPLVQVFADVTRSRDVPDFTDLAQTNTTGPSFTPLRQQTAWTYEAGARGAAGPVNFDVTLYRAHIRGELLQFVIDPNIPAATFNAGSTRHQGVEASVGLDVMKWAAPQEQEHGFKLTGLWNHNDFTFRHDRQYRDNRIAGTPKDVLRFEARYTKAHLGAGTEAYLAPQVDWVPQGAWADQANTVRAPGYTLLGVEAGVKLPRGVSLYVEGRNLTNEAYISDVGAVTNLALPSVSKSIYYPGERRAVYAGARMAF